MGEAKRRKQKRAAQAAADIRAMADIPIALPAAMGEAPQLDADTRRKLFAIAAAERHAKLAGIRQALAKEPDKLVNIVLGALEAIFSDNDDIRESLVNHESTKKDYVIACKKGCSWCCYQNVEVTIPETILAAIEVGISDDPRQQTVRDTAAAIAGLDNIERVQTGKPCPFLVDNACSIYQRRPIPCRNFLAPDAEGCRTGLMSVIEGREPVRIHSHGTPQMFGRAFQAAVQGVCKDLGLQHDFVDLTQTVAAIIADPTLIEAWAGGAAAFTPFQRARSAQITSTP
jgi:Fe-S-cluster containining protein